MVVGATAAYRPNLFSASLRPRSVAESAVDASLGLVDVIALRPPLCRKLHIARNAKVSLRRTTSTSQRGYPFWVIVPKRSFPEVVRAMR